MDALTLHYTKLVFGQSQPIYELHRDLCRALGKREAGGYLFRTEVDRTEPPAMRVVLVQSRSPGNWAALGDRLALIEARERRWDLLPGQRYRFFLRANTTTAKKARLHELAGAPRETFRAARGKRVAVRGEAALLAWLDRQGETHGFRSVETSFRQEDAMPGVVVPAVRIQSERDVDWRGNGKHGCHAGVDFEGLLIVADAVRLTAALRGGIGPGKAFGFGLLSLAPI